MVYISSKLLDMQKYRSPEVVLASAFCFLCKGQMGVIPDVIKSIGSLFGKYVGSLLKTL